MGVEIMKDKVYLLIEISVVCEEGKPIGFFYDKEKAEKKMKELIRMHEENQTFKWFFYRIEEVDLMEG